MAHIKKLFRGKPFLIAITAALAVPAVALFPGGGGGRSAAQSGPGGSASVEERLSAIERRLAESAAPKVAWIDVIQVLRKDVIYKDKSEELQKKASEERQKTELEFLEKIEQQRNKAHSHSPGSTEWRKGNRALIDLQLATLEAARRLQTKYQDDLLELKTDVYERLMKALRALCDEEGYDVVLRLTSSGSADADAKMNDITLAFGSVAAVVHLANRRHDITDKVIERMNKR